MKRERGRKLSPTLLSLLPDPLYCGMEPHILTPYPPCHQGLPAWTRSPNKPSSLRLLLVGCLIVAPRRVTKPKAVEWSLRGGSLWECPDPGGKVCPGQDCTLPSLLARKGATWLYHMPLPCCAASYSFNTIGPWQKPEMLNPINPF